MFVGPTCPVEVEEMNCSNRPYQAAITVLNPNGQVVTQFQTDTNGHLQIALEPGTYTLRPESTGPYPFAKEQTATIIRGQFTPVAIVYDNGIR